MNAQLEGHFSKAAAATALKINEEQITSIYCGGEEYWDAFTSVEFTVNDTVETPNQYLLGVWTHVCIPFFSKGYSLFLTLMFCRI